MRRRLRMDDIRILVEEAMRLDMPDGTETLPGMSCLTEDQQRVLRAAYGIIMKHRALLLCEMTGTGKTYVASALAAVLKSACVVIAPAHLLDNWRDVLARFRVDAEFYSYQAASLGKIPDRCGWNQTWIFDEAHFLKNPATRRWQNLIPLAARHRVCLVTATPLSLGWRDLYALMAFCGYPRNPRMMRASHVYAFAYAMMPMSRTERLEIAQIPSVCRHEISYRLEREADIQYCLREIAECAWFTCTEEQTVEKVPILRDVLRHRMLSHRTACLGSLRRIQKYYRACRLDPHRRLLSRKAFVRLVGVEGVQQILPFEEVVFGGARAEAQALEADWTRLGNAIRRLDALCRLCDEKLQALVQYIRTLPGNVQIILFTQYRDTALYFDDALRNIAICALMTSQEVRYKGLSVAPDVVMAMFDPNCRMPDWWRQLKRQDAQILICTDAFACGQNFQKASVMIHLDLPWNPTTLAQREGRIIRRGQKSSVVHIASCSLSGESELAGFEKSLDARLHMRRTLQHNWISEYAKVTVPKEMLIVPGRDWPNFWGKFDESWLPAAPECALRMHTQKVSNIKFSSVFDDNLKRYRKQLLAHWTMLDGNRDSAVFHAFRKKVASLRICACYPQLEAVLDDPRLLDNSKITVPGPDVRCYHIHSYPENMPTNSQSIHKLSTG